MTEPNTVLGESAIQAAVLKRLTDLGCFVWRNNTGSFVRNYFSQREGRMKQTFFRAGRKGLPDIVGLTPSGKFIGLEIKSKTGKVSPEQKEVLATMKRMGAIAGVVRDISILDGIEKYL